MKKVFRSLLIVVSFVLFLTGCSTFKSYTFNVETGDSIEVKLATNGGYNLSSSIPFTISKDGKELSQGTFITLYGYNQYIDTFNNDTRTKILDSGNKNGITYTFYSYNDSEFDYVIKINNSNTAILLGNPNSQAEAQEVFNLLTFSVK